MFRVGVGDYGRLTRDEGAPPKSRRNHRECPCAAGKRECCYGPDAVDKRAGAGGSDGAADCRRGGQPGEGLGYRACRGGVVDHRVQGAFSRRDRGAGEEQHGPERKDASARRD